MSASSIGTLLAHTSMDHNLREQIVEILQLEDVDEKERIISAVLTDGRQALARYQSVLIPEVYSAEMTTVVNASGVRLVKETSLLKLLKKHVFDKWEKMCENEPVIWVFINRIRDENADHFQATLRHTAECGNTYVQTTSILAVIVQLLFQGIDDHCLRTESVFNDLFSAVTNEGLQACARFARYVSEDDLKEQTDNPNSALFQALHIYYKETIPKLFQEYKIPDSKQSLYSLAIDNVTKNGWLDGIESIRSKIPPVKYEPLLQAVKDRLRLTTRSLFNKWKKDAITWAGGNGQGNHLNQLSRSKGICVNENKDIYVADCYNHRIVCWQRAAKRGEIIAGPNGWMRQKNLLNGPTDITIGNPSQSLIIADAGNRRVIRWSGPNQASEETLLDNIDCWGLAIDKEGFLYVSDWKRNEVRRWHERDKRGTIVLGGTQQGNLSLNSPTYIFVDDDQSIYVSDTNNHRVVKWSSDAREGMIVAGGNNEGNKLDQLSSPLGVIVDAWGYIYVADYGNHRVMRWCQGEKEGTIVAGGNDWGNGSNQLNGPVGLSFDDEGNLYVADSGNDRIQRFAILQD